MLCNECDKRNICTELCEAAEKYAGQDKPNYHKPGEGVHFTPMERAILRFLAKGQTRAQIRNRLKLSVHSLEVHISNLSKKAQEIVFTM